MTKRAPEKQSKRHRQTRFINRNSTVSTKDREIISLSTTLPSFYKRKKEQNKNKKESEKVKGTRFQKGKSGNPNGRPPKEKCIPDILQEIGMEQTPYEIYRTLRKYYPHLPRETSGLRAMLYRCYIQAQLGFKEAREFIAERTEGKIKQALGLDFDPNVIQSKLNLGPENAPEPLTDSLADGNGT